MSTRPLPEPLRLRLRLTKKARARFLSHAEYSRAIMFAARRSGLPLEFAGKHRPRLKLSLSPPLPIGVESGGELVDLSLVGYVPAAEAKRALSEVLPPGIEVVEARLMSGSDKAVGKLIDTAAYLVSPPEDAGTPRGWRDAAVEFMSRDSVEFTRVQPRRTRVVDIRKGVHRLDVEELEGDGVTLALALDDGVAGTVKPWEVIEVLGGMAGVSMEVLKGSRITREGLFSRRGDRLVSPMELGRRGAAAPRGRR
ncbi:MAG: TIGR03936 family radical SAM-associated protein [Actinobacteria bacterium]|nr:TIGR03936 family radical SAM-associated protein [Actinomycetota bacterium]MBU1944472.1 TIGR03936 family radical SAM-associated protein [Actinomycetota bacterium]MBU2688637.1 TIGR03936 family radical SAM-associated protein [Actinomycetota bacterium]